MNDDRTTTDVSPAPNPAPAEPTPTPSTDTPAAKQHDMFARGSLPSTHTPIARGTPLPEGLRPNLVEQVVDTMARQVAPKTKPDAIDLEDIQGLVYSGWGEHKFAGYLFATLGTDTLLSRAWLASICPQVSSAATKRGAAGARVNVAFSPDGLAKLGVPQETVDALPQEAKRGMASRARILGDDPPEEWELGRDNELDVLVMVFARTEDERTDLMTTHRDMLRDAGASVRPDELSHDLNGKEHFGFADGVSQPFLAGKQDAPPTSKTASPDDPTPPTGERALPTGEILLGYKNAYGQTPKSPQWGATDIGRNGTYLVFRKLHQHVDRFWGYVAARARELEPTNPDAAAHLTEMLAAKLVGRWKSGAPLVLSPDRDDEKYATPDHINRFAYKAIDPHGERCPISSHVRRANPRDARGGSASDSNKVVERHRILRRGRSYGTPLPDRDAVEGHDDNKPRGLYFISLQASIARGFEFIQQTWLSNPGFGGLFCEPDPIMGNGDGTSDVTIPMAPLRLRLPNVPSVVTVKGGGYFLLPSLTALTRIAAG